MFSEDEDLYQELLLDYGKHPRNCRCPEHVTHKAKGVNTSCGDKLEVYLLEGDDGSLKDVAFLGEGCAISMASASIMTDLLKNKSKEEAIKWIEEAISVCKGEGSSEDEEIMILSGVYKYPMRVKCATLAWQTVLKALKG